MRSNFIETFKEGQAGANKGLDMGLALSPVSKTINGVQRARIYTIAAAPKGGKTTVVDVGFVIEPILYVLGNNELLDKKITEVQCSSMPSAQKDVEIALLNSQKVNLEIIYHSYEIDRVSKEFDFVSHFLYRDYGVRYIQFEDGKTYRGKDFIEINSEYLMGMCKYDSGELIQVGPRLLDAIKDIYERRIVPIFGEYSMEGILLKKGIVTVLEKKDNPTGIRNYLLNYAAQRGRLLYDVYKDEKGFEHKTYTGFVPNDPNLFTLVITDHVRKAKRERGFTLKENVDKLSEYTVELRNACKFSFVHIIHLNRSMNDVERMRYLGDMLFPTAEDIKETGNLSEDSNHIFTLFNPNDEKFRLKTHFGAKIKDAKHNPLYPDMRTIHLVESRHAPYPQHFRVNLLGAVKHLETLTIP